MFAERMIPRPIGAAARRFRGSAGHLIQPLGAVMSRGLEIAIKFVFQIVVARALGASQAGLFLLALSVVSVMQCAAKFSIDRALVPSVARLLRAGDRRAAFAEIVSALGLILLTSGIIGLALFACASPVASWLFRKPELAGSLQLMALAMVALCVLNGVVGALTGLGAAAIGEVLRNSVWPLLCALLLLALGLGSATGASAATAGAILLAALMAWLLMRRLVRAPWPELRRLKLPDNLRTIAFPLWAVDTIDVIVISVPTIVLGAWGTSGEVAIFSVANRIALIFVAIIGAVGNAASPRFALISDERNPDRLARALRDVALLAGGSCLPLAAALLFFPHQIMGLFGPEYVEGTTVLRILVVGNLVNAAFACTFDVLAMSGNGNLLRRIRFFTLAACLIMSFTLIPLFGSIGAAVATAVTLAASGLASGIAVNRRLHFPVVPMLAGWFPSR